MSVLIGQSVKSWLLLRNSSPVPCPGPGSVNPRGDDALRSRRPGSPNDQKGGERNSIFFICVREEISDVTTIKGDRGDASAEFWSRLSLTIHPHSLCSLRTASSTTRRPPSRTVAMPLSTLVTRTSSSWTMALLEGALSGRRRKSSQIWSRDRLTQEARSIHR